MMSVTLSLKPKPTTIFLTYAPDTSYDTNIINEFYNLLQSSIDALPKNQSYVILGNFNVKVGKGAHLTWSEVVGQFTLCTQNESGEKMLL